MSATSRTPSTDPHDASHRGLRIVRRFPASRAAVWAAWTTPEGLRWFAGDSPLDEARPTTVDLRPGGAWRVRLHEGGHGGREYTTGGVYREVVVGERLRFAWGAVGGWPDLDPDHLDDVPQVSVALSDVGDDDAPITQMVFGLDFAPTLSEAQARSWLALGIRDGWTHTVERLTPAV